MNGYQYSEDVEYDELYNYTFSRRKPFIRNEYYYHVDLFRPTEQHCVVRETEKAVLFGVPDGQFWVPKSLMNGRRTKVWRQFRRRYV